MYGKSLSAGPCEVSSIDLAIKTYAPGNINCEVFHMSLLEHDH